MTREQVIEWAKQCEYTVGYLGAMYNDPISLQRLEALARLARADMREQCAKKCESLGWGNCKDVNPRAGTTCAEAIRNLEV
jgi:hypothetical protein